MTPVGLFEAEQVHGVAFRRPFGTNKKGGAYSTDTGVSNIQCRFRDGSR